VQGHVVLLVLAHVAWLWALILGREWMSWPAWVRGLKHDSYLPPQAFVIEAS
jgi:hypothetical protein